MARSAVRIIPLGGLGEVGKNMTVFEQDGRMVVIDAGLSFPREEMLGIDIVLPDFSYVAERADRLEAVILTHGHEDHIGALPYLLREVGTQAEVWGTRLTLGLVKSKLDEHGLLSHVDLVEVEPGGPAVEVGPFRAEFARVTHSVPDAVAVVLHTDHGTIVHTGDFKLDSDPIDGRLTDLERLRALGDEGVALLMADSTNAERPGSTPSERTVGAALQKIVADARGRVIVTSFSSHIHRIQQVIDAAVENGRVVAVVGRSMSRNLNIARNLGYAEVPDDVLIKPRRLEEFMPHEVVVICTGSQGEPLSALTRIAAGLHPAVQVHHTDTVVVSARAIPGNEARVNDTVNRLCRRGARVMTDETDYVTVSGHAAGDDLRTMLDTVRPRAFVPVHGEFRMLQAHARIARATGVPDHAIRVAENGTVLELDGDGLTVTGRIEAGQTLVDGLNIGEVGDEVLRDRRHLANDGVVIVVVTISAQTGEAVADPEVIVRGLEAPEADADLLDRAVDAVERVLEESAGSGTTEQHILQQQLHDAVAQLVSTLTGKRPMVLPVVVEV
ncbi:MAG TPA: ribonuclease J [Thermoleophilia bacterium]|nr:ribonuclease J [Thermoleophilia bacterium]